ncbi:MAG: universal stress protein [Chitinispirillaceae bacterium]|nr:universal stress protein [Chitinispirillaceae bacterium]
MPRLLEKILVYIDGSEQSITAAQYAICLSQSTGAPLIALYVINTRALDDLVKASIFLMEEQEEYSQDIEADAIRYLNLVSDLARRKGIAIETVSRKGSIHQEILAAIRENGIDLLVIGELSRIRSRRDELYNDTERAMRQVNCSVLIVKDEDRVNDLFESGTV